MARQYNEAKEQKALISWVKFNPKLKPFIFAIPNGGKRDAWEAAHLKAQGVLAGVCDLFLMLPCNGYHGLFIEMKGKDGRLTDNQKTFINNATYVGYDVCVAYNWLEAKHKIVSYLKHSVYEGFVNESITTKGLSSETVARDDRAMDTKL